MVSEPTTSQTSGLSSTTSQQMAANTPPPSTTIDKIPNLKNQLQFISVKLNDENFLVWKKQIVAVLNSLDIHDYIDSTKSPPPATIIDATTNNSMPNPSYLFWCKVDKSLITFLQATFDTPLLARTPTFTSSLELFLYLEKAFTAQITSRTHQLLTQLHQIQRGTRSINEYLGNIKTLADALSYTPTPISDPVLVQHTLRGLGAEYDQFVTAIETRESLPTFAQLYPLLLNHEVRLIQSHNLTLNQFQSSAFISQSIHKQTPVSHHSISTPNRTRPIMHSPQTSYHNRGGRNGVLGGRNGRGNGGRGNGPGDRRGRNTGGPYHSSASQNSVLGAPPPF